MGTAAWKGTYKNELPSPVLQKEGEQSVTNPSSKLIKVTGEFTEYEKSGGN
jgi:hypothetical protein